MRTPNSAKQKAAIIVTRPETRKQKMATGPASCLATTPSRTYPPDPTIAPRAAHDHREGTRKLSPHHKWNNSGIFKTVVFIEKRQGCQIEAKSNRVYLSNSTFLVKSNGLLCNSNQMTNSSFERIYLDKEPEQENAPNRDSIQYSEKLTTLNYKTDWQIFLGS